MNAVYILTFLSHRTGPKMRKLHNYLIFTTYSECQRIICHPVLSSLDFEKL